MKYADINTLSLVDVGGLSNYDLIGFHDLMKDSQQSIADDFFYKFEQGEELPSGAFQIIFEHFNYDDFSEEALSILQKLMLAEKLGKLPQIIAGYPNNKLLVEYYIKAMDGFIYNDKAYIWVNDEKPQQYISYFRSFSKDSGLYLDSDKEYLDEQISNWNSKIAEIIAQYTLDKRDYESEGLTVEDFSNWTDMALSYDPNNSTALKLKLWCNENKND